MGQIGSISWILEHCSKKYLCPYISRVIVLCCTNRGLSALAIWDRDANVDLRHLSVKVPKPSTIGRTASHSAPVDQQYISARNVTRGMESTRLRRWYPLHRRGSARPRYREAWTASFLAMAPALEPPQVYRRVICSNAKPLFRARPRFIRRPPLLLAV